MQNEKDKITFLNYLTAAIQLFTYNIVSLVILNYQLIELEVTFSIIKSLKHRNMLILVISLIVAAIVRLFTYNRAEHCLQVKNVDIEQLK